MGLRPWYLPVRQAGLLRASAERIPCPPYKTFAGAAPKQKTLRIAYSAVAAATAAKAGHPLDIRPSFSAKADKAFICLTQNVLQLDGNTMIQALFIFLLGALAVLVTLLVGLVSWIALKLFKEELNLKITIKSDKPKDNL